LLDDREPKMPDDDSRMRKSLSRRLIPEVRTALKVAPRVRAWPLDWDDRGAISYFYQSGSILTRDADVTRVHGVLNDLGALPEDSEVPESGARGGRENSPNLVRGITRLTARVRESQHTPDVLEDLDRRLGVGVATHDHVFVVARNYVTVCPASEPEPVLTAQAAGHRPAAAEVIWPRTFDPEAGRGVRVSVVDTGLLPDAADWAPWLAGVRPHSAADVEDPDQLKLDGEGRGRDGFADPYAGHGTFVAGVVRSVAPASDITVEKVIQFSGFALESSLVTQLHDALSRAPDLICMPAGGYTRGNVPPLSFQILQEQWLSQLGGVQIVAAAGNDSFTDPFWPAAFPWCIGVGSMSRDGQTRSSFSNYGAWVDVYAPGEDIVNAYARMKYKTAEKGHIRDTSAGIVRWSGTSFATPIVAGLMTARMGRTGENAREASESLLKAARGQFRPGVGPRLFP
jgi:hypothetical protein